MNCYRFAAARTHPILGQVILQSSRKSPQKNPVRL